MMLTTVTVALQESGREAEAGEGHGQEGRQDEHVF